MSETNGTSVVEFEERVELVPLDSLKPHPRNYREHPNDQLEHIARSIQDHGVYRNIVVARDGTILAGHGVSMALRKLGRTHAAVVRLDVDPDEPKALQVLAGDNEIGNLALVDDRKLTDMLKELRDDGLLLGTGFDDQSLAALAMVTRPQSEIADFDAASEWVGMPEFDTSGIENQVEINLKFRSAEDRKAFIDKVQLDVSTFTSTRNERFLSGWWPPREQRDLSSVELTDA